MPNSSCYTVNTCEQQAQCAALATACYPKAHKQNSQVLPQVQFDSAAVGSAAAAAAGAAAAAATGLSLSRDRMSSSLSTMYLLPSVVSMLSPAYLKYSTCTQHQGQVQSHAGKVDVCMSYRPQDCVPLTHVWQARPLKGLNAPGWCANQCQVLQWQEGCGAPQDRKQVPCHPSPYLRCSRLGCRYYMC